MMEIFLMQLLAAGLGALSTASADWCYNRARIGARLHAFWVSASIAAICLPVLAWTSTICSGNRWSGSLSARCFFGSTITCRTSRPGRKIGSADPRRPSSGGGPPASTLNG